MSMLSGCLEQIRELDPAVRAWVEVNPQEPLSSGPLDGIPFGAKDIFETRGMATEFGSPIFAGRKGCCDADLITDLRQRGAVLLGKTHTTAFAYFDPAPTRNPHNLQHTPGGSSSGSAAAVACSMAKFALGSQTAGSIIRPASYCGVVGFKPSFGVLSREGVMPFAPSLDTMGLFTADVPWMAKIWKALGFRVTSVRPVILKVPRALPEVEPEMAKAFAKTLAILRRAGFRQEPINLSFEWTALSAAVSSIQAFEGARSLRGPWEQHGTRVGAKLAALIERGFAMGEDEYADALAAIQYAASRMTGTGFILTPAAMGPAPEGLSSTGAPMMNSPWTGLGMPAISIPMPTPTLPLGLQIAGARGSDGELLDVAEQIASALNNSA
jgi:Asp-tRNA(Asn)/Glu-tRNA(Gln) amidotransferase A subunit family amidase